jgi:hypothetical protein
MPVILLRGILKRRKTRPAFEGGRNENIKSRVWLRARIQTYLSESLCRLSKRKPVVALANRMIE